MSNVIYGVLRLTSSISPLYRLSMHILALCIFVLGILAFPGYNIYQYICNITLEVISAINTIPLFPHVSHGCLM
jgi:hypothetical protein